MRGGAVQHTCQPQCTPSDAFQIVNILGWVQQMPARQLHKTRPLQVLTFHRGLIDDVHVARAFANVHQYKKKKERETRKRFLGHDTCKAYNDSIGQMIILLIALQVPTGLSFNKLRNDANADPAVDPLITLKMFNTPNDDFIHKHAVRKCR